MGKRRFSFFITHNGLGVSVSFSLFFWDLGPRHVSCRVVGTGRIQQASPWRLMACALRSNACDGPCCRTKGYAGMGGMEWKRRSTWSLACGRLGWAWGS